MDECGFGNLPSCESKCEPFERCSLLCAACSCFALPALGGYTTCGCSSASISSQPHALPQEARVCSRAAPTGALQPAGTKHLAGALLALHLKTFPSIEAQGKASCGLWPR